MIGIFGTVFEGSDMMLRQFEKFCSGSVIIEISLALLDGGGAGKY